MIKDILKFLGQAIAASSLFVAIMGVINIVIDGNWGIGSGSNVTPLPKDPIELAILVIFLLLFAGLLWLIGSTGDIFRVIKQKPKKAFAMLATLSALVIIGGNFGLTQLMGGPLQRAVEMGNTQEVETLVAQNSYEPEALSKPLYFSLNQADYTMAEAIVAAGADVNHIDDNEFKTSILQSSVFHFEADAVEFLLNNGADPNIQDSLGRTAMVIAVTYRDGDFPGEDPLRVLKMLHAAGGDFTIAADNGDTVSAIAQRNNNQPVIDYLDQLSTTARDSE